LGNLTTPKRVQKLQMALHAKAKAEAGYRFYALYDKASRKTPFNRVALRDRRGVVVGGIELGTVHFAVQHGAGSGRNSVDVGSTAVCHAFGAGW